MSAKIVHGDTCRPGELVKISPDAENHWACRKFVGMVGTLRAKDEYAGRTGSYQTNVATLFYFLVYRVVGRISGT